MIQATAHTVLSPRKASNRGAMEWPILQTLLLHLTASFSTLGIAPAPRARTSIVVSESPNRLLKLYN